MTHHARPIALRAMIVLALFLSSCQPKSENVGKITPGMTMSEVKDLLGEPKRSFPGREDMVFARPDSLGEIGFQRTDSIHCVEWEYYVVRYEALGTKGATFTIDPLHGNRESRQPANSLRVLRDFQVIFDRGSGLVIECGFRPVGFVDLATGQPAVLARVDSSS
ncbi:MAG: hypothetical protein WB699_02000 [Bacteroidota bacterium]